MAKKRKKIDETNEVEVVNPEDLLIENEKKEKKKRFFDEFKAFLILALIIAIMVVIGVLWYKHTPKEEKGKPNVNDQMGYKYVSYEVEDGNHLNVLNDEYVILSDDTSVLKVMDLDLNVLYENEVAFNGYYIAKDGKLYFYKEEENDEDDSNTISIYRLEGNELEDVKTLHKDNVYYRTIYQGEFGHEIVIGYSGVSTNPDDKSDKEYIYILNGKEYELEGISLVSSDAMLAVTDPLYINNDKYMVYLDQDKKYGIYNIVDNTKIVDANYDRLYVDKNSKNFIAIKNNKAGIINSSLKKIVDYNYDFIDVNDGFYVVGKNNKLALMDSNYKLITNFEFDYQDVLNTDYIYNECCGVYNTFAAYKTNDKYLLVTNVDDLTSEEEYSKHEAYLIDQTGKYEVIKEHDYDILPDDNLIWLYDKDKMEYTFYDLGFNELYKLDFKNYDYDNEPTFKISYGTLVSNFLESNLYYDLKTGESIEKMKDYEEKFLDDVTFKLDSNNKKVRVMIKDKEIFTGNYDFNEEYKLFNKVDERIIYYNNLEYFMIRKGD